MFIRASFVLTSIDGTATLKLRLGTNIPLLPGGTLLAEHQSHRGSLVWLSSLRTEKTGGKTKERWLSSMVSVEATRKN
jgi:hypothetical protein